MRDQRLITLIDHKSLTHPRIIHEDARTLRQRMHVEKFAPIIKCVKEDNNGTADNLSRAPQNKEVMTSEEKITVIEECNANKQKRKGVKNMEHKNVQ